MNVFSFGKRVLLTFLLSVGFSFFSFAQEKKSDRFGILLAGESISQSFFPIVGITYEHMFTRRSGMDVGLFYRLEKNEFLVSTYDPSGMPTFYLLKLTEGYINIPVLYRFDAGFAHFSFGPQIDIFTNWQQRKGETLEITSYRKTPRVDFGALLKIGREIPFKGSLIFEPELRIGMRPFEVGNPYIGIGLRFKKAFVSSQ